MTVNRFYSIEQQQMLLEAEKVGLFTSHAPTIGSYREAILRAYIKKLMPRSLIVKSGFVSPNTSQDRLSVGQSQQIDLLIFESDRYAPLLDADNFSVIRPDALHGAIEVKSTLSFYKKSNPSGDSDPSDEYPFVTSNVAPYRWAGTLVDSLINFKTLARSCATREKRAYLTAVFAFSASFDLTQFYLALETGQLQRQLQICHLRELPTSICVLGKSLVMLFPHDMFDRSRPEAIGQSYFNELHAIEGHEQYPFQFFSVLAHNQVTATYTGRVPDSVGLFAAIGATTRLRSRPFNLASDDM